MKMYRAYTLLGLVVVMLLITSCDNRFANKFWSQGDMLYDAGDYDNAMQAYNQSLGAKEQFETAFNLGNAAFQSKKVDESDEAYNLALTLAKSEQEISLTHYNLGNLYHSNLEQKEELVKAIDNYKMAIRFDGDNLRAQGNLLLAQKMMEQVEEKEEQQKQQQKQQQNKGNQDKQKQEQKSHDQQLDDKQQSKEQQQKENQDQQNQQDQDQDHQNQDQGEQNQGQQAQDQKEINKEEIAKILRMVSEEDQRVQGKLMKKQSDNTKETKKKW